MSAKLNARDISALLAERIEALAIALVGGQPTTKSRAAWRFYPKGGLVVTVSGKDRGLWCHHGDGAKGGDALDLVRHLRKCDTRAALEWAQDWLGTSNDDELRPEPNRSAAPPPEPERDVESTLPLAQRIWCEGGPPEKTVSRYLAGRGGLVAPRNGVIRFHPSCPRGAERWPAMLALMTNATTNQPCGVHRTFLLLDGSGKAPGKAKLMLGNAGIIRLSPDEDVTLGLGICEGIETGLAILQRYEWAPVWACGSAGAIRKFPVLAGIEALTIFPDMDDAGTGIDVARTCATRWADAGRETEIMKPPNGRDWHDAGGPAA